MYTFLVGTEKDLEKDFEEKIEDFSGDFQINLYACAAAPQKAIYDYIRVEDEAPKDVASGDLLTTTWADIKSR